MTTKNRRQNGVENKLVWGIKMSMLLAKPRACCLGFGDDRRGILGDRDVSIFIFITGRKCFSSFRYRFFHFMTSLSLHYRASPLNE